MYLKQSIAYTTKFWRRFWLKQNSKKRRKPVILTLYCMRYHHTSWLWYSLLVYHDLSVHGKHGIHQPMGGRENYVKQVYACVCTVCTAWVNESQKIEITAIIIKRLLRKILVGPPWYGFHCKQSKQQDIKEPYLMSIVEITTRSSHNQCPVLSSIFQERKLPILWKAYTNSYQCRDQHKSYHFHDEPIVKQGGNGAGSQSSQLSSRLGNK